MSRKVADFPPRSAAGTNTESEITIQFNLSVTLPGAVATRLRRLDHNRLARSMWCVAALQRSRFPSGATHPILADLSG